jgi:hypothetical protein
MAKQQQQQPGAGLSDQSQGSLVQLGKMMGPQTDAFDDEVQQLQNKRHQAEHDATDYDKEFAHEASYAKMRTAESGGGDTDLGPTKMAQAQVKQRGVLGQEATTAGARQAQQAQGQMTSPTPPEAPGGPVGATTPFPAQAGPEPQPPVMPPQAVQQGPGAPPAPGAPGS